MEGPPVWKDGVRGGRLGAGERLRGKIDDVLRPAEVAMLVDAGFVSPGPSGRIRMGDPLNLLKTRVAHGPLLEHCEATLYSLPTQRHLRVGLNVAYVEGHARTVKRRGRTPAIAQIDPPFAYRPMTRVSPYKEGPYPVP